MPITVGGTNITYNDSTLQGTAWAGARGQAFTANGTFTIPAGVRQLKITVVGGGGSANYLVGNNGGNSTVASGTQTITTITGGGGNRGSFSSPGTGSGGTATNGTLNFPGGDANESSTGGKGGSSLLSTSAGGTTNNSGTVGKAYGGGASYILTGCIPGIGGGGGGTAIAWLTGLTPGNTLAVTIGAGGTGAYNGAAGVVVFEW